MIKGSSWLGPCVAMKFIVPELRRGFGNAAFKLKVIKPKRSPPSVSADIKGILRM
jgi:hypothetical protein